MGISKEQLINAAKEILTEPLGEYGYQFSKKNFGTGGFSFVKQNSSMNLYYFIEVQPSGFGRNDIFDMYINIIRKGSISRKEPDLSDPAIQKFDMRLGPHIYGTRERARSEPQWQWHFQSEAEAKTAFLDVLPALTDYAIPFLENPGSSKWDLIGLLRD